MMSQRRKKRTRAGCCWCWGRRGPVGVSRLPGFSTNERKGVTHSSNSPESSALLGKGAGLYRKGHELIEVSLLRGWWLLARCWDWEGGER